MALIIRSKRTRSLLVRSLLVLPLQQVLAITALVAGILLPVWSAHAADSEAAKSASQQRPNFLVILADDLGFSDLGAFGGEISTPQLDQLAAEGLRLTNMHVAPTCSPTRAMLLTGTDHHLAGLANMHELITPSQRGKPGYEGHLNDRVVTVAERLRNAGYRTLMSGKWHLGTALSEDPHHRGFEQAFTLLEGGHNHFGKPNLPPASQGGPHYREHGVPVSVPADFYSSDYFTDKLLQYLDTDRSQPFFAYLPFTAPHWPLHAPAELIEKYRGRYDAGWPALWKERIQRQRELGLLPANADTSTPATLRDWDALSPEQQRGQASKMEIYAAMVDRMDWNVGRVIDYLRQSGRLDNTVVIFLSDNGAAPDTLTGMAQKVPGFPPTDEGDRSRWGTVDSMLAYGPQWAQVASAPRRLYKSVTTEGGLLSPTIIRYPGFARQAGVDGSFVTVMDLVPTMLEMAGVDHSVASDHSGPGRDRAQPEPIRGRSLLSYLQRHAAQVHSDEQAFGWELFGQRALHQGDWKITWIGAPNGSGHWELYNLVQDPGERRDLSREYPERMQSMLRLWDEYAEEMGIILENQVVSPYTNL